jgi:hypothetical protein
MGKHGAMAEKIVVCGALLGASQEASALMAHGPMWAAHPSMARSPTGAMLAIDALGLLGAMVCALAAGWKIYLGLSRRRVEAGTALPWLAIFLSLAMCLMVPIAAHEGLGLGAEAVFGGNDYPVWTAYPTGWLGIVALALGFAGFLLGKRVLDIRFDEGAWDGAMLARSVVLSAMSALLFWAMLAAR